MFEVELHSHTLFSKCGLHTIIEMLNAGKEAGLKALAITDHGPAVQGHQASPFFHRLGNPVPGIHLLKGVECNVVEESGEVDIAKKFVPYSDVLLVGLHTNLPSTLDKKTATAHLINSLAKNPWLDIVSHPLNFDFEIDFHLLAKEARRMGRALEFNASKLQQGKVSVEDTRNFIRICKEEGCLTAVNTDAHVTHELGRTSEMEELLLLEDFPFDRIVNRTFESTMAWLDERRQHKIL
ncbi:MAG: PHP domain-containing protein [Spirochaetales bacterium]|nr:PHP domain-containing protein [Spirochaetales bacterium]